MRVFSRSPLKNIHVGLIFTTCHEIRHNQTMILKLLFITTLLCVIVARYVEAFPSGAGACPGGMAAVGGSHLSTAKGKKVLSRSFAAKKISISIGGVSVAEGKTISIAAGKTHAIMDGILIRVQAPTGFSTKGVLTPGIGTQTAKVCPYPVVGLTHLSDDDNEKSQNEVESVEEDDSFTGNIRFKKATKGVIFDLTVVFKNSKTISEFAYGQVKVNFI